MTFARDAFVFRGKYSDIVKSLCTPCDNHQIFSTYYQAYVFGALYGVLNGRYISPSNNTGEGEATIKADVMNRASGIENYDLVRKIVILHETQRKLNFAQKLDNALRFDNSVDESTPEVLRESSKYDENTILLNGYVLGGLSDFYDKLSKFKKSEDIMMFMNDTIADFLSDTASDSGSDSLEMNYEN